MQAPDSHSEVDPQVPDPLAAGLRRTYGGGGLATESMDRAVLELARERGAAIRRRRRVHRIMGRGAAIAAAAGLAMAAVIIPKLGARPPLGPVAMAPGSLASSVAGDVNGDGVVDILDALALALRLEEGPAEMLGAEARWDLNLDGAVDGRDVDAIAQAAVRLEGRG